MEPEKSEINWQLICRICLQSSDPNMKFIFNDSSLTGGEDVVGKIIKCGGVPVQIRDGMPERICSRCLVDLEIAFTFRNTCQESYYQLLKFIKTREQCKGVEIEGDSDVKFIKEESTYNETDFTVQILETNGGQDSADNGCFAEITHENEETKMLDKVLSDPEEEQLEPLNTKKRKQKPRAKSKKVKKNEPRGRKPNPISKFICHICGNIYDIQSRLTQHIKTHTVEKEHECEICGKKFAAAAQIPRHMNTHTGNRPYKCKFCPSSFGDSSTRNKHERIHTNERPFKCLECGKSFAYTNVLKVHMALHTGERPYSCSICGKRFSQRHHQQSHERTHKNVNASGRNVKIN